MKSTSSAKCLYAMIVWLGSTMKNTEFGGLRTGLKKTKTNLRIFAAFK